MKLNKSRNLLNLLIVYVLPHTKILRIKIEPVQRLQDNENLINTVTQLSYSGSSAFSRENDYSLIHEPLWIVSNFHFRE